MIALGDYTKYGAIMAKVSVMKRGLLTKEDYLQMIQKKSVAEIAAFLKNETAYADCFNQINENNIHRGELERILKHTYNDDLIKLYQFENGDNKKFYTYVFIRAEIEIIKIILRRLQNNETDLDWIADVPDFFKKHFTVHVDQLVKSKDIREFLENLSGSRYEHILTPLVTLKEHQTLFSIETTLDMYYFNLVSKLKDALVDKEDKILMEHTVGSEVDLLNLLWIYRCKKYYKTPNELIYSFIIPSYYKLSKVTIVQLVESASEDEFLSLVNNLPYKKAFGDSIGEFYEYNYHSFVYSMHKKMYKTYPFSIEAVVSYLHFKEIEVNNITSIVEGIRYGLPPDEIKPYIVGFEL